ncbi:MAG: GIY-YIG nuclease family protein [Rubrivivax sp.]|nr:GIY-YIG nuclease family protein [Pyrinomonadaceae bacterium]
MARRRDEHKVSAFIELVAGGLSHRRAVHNAGWNQTDDSASVTANRLMKDPDIRARVEARRAEILETLKQPENILNRMMPLGRSRPPLVWVYVIRAVGMGRYKIGYAEADPWRKMATFQIGSPVRLEMVACWKAPHGAVAELHGKFNSRRARGEWFDLGDEDIRELIVLAGCVVEDAAAGRHIGGHGHETRFVEAPS